MRDVHPRERLPHIRVRPAHAVERRRSLLPRLGRIGRRCGSRLRAPLRRLVVHVVLSTGSSGLLLLLAALFLLLRLRCLLLWLLLLLLRSLLALSLLLLSLPLLPPLPPPLSQFLSRVLVVR